MTRPMSPASLTELALVFADQSQRPAINAGLSMLEALNLTLPAAGTEEAQLTRLAWWDGELQRYLAGTPEHPATRELAAQGLAILQAPYWQTLIRAQAKRTTTPNPDAHALQEISASMGAGFAAIATLVGAGASANEYQQAGGNIWLIEQLIDMPTPHRGHTAMMQTAAEQLAQVGVMLSNAQQGATHRFMVVLAKLFERTAQREAHRPGAGIPGALTRPWIAWRAATQVR